MFFPTGCKTQSGREWIELVEFDLILIETSQVYNEFIIFSNLEATKKLPLADPKTDIATAMGIKNVAVPRALFPQSFNFKNSRFLVTIKLQRKLEHYLDRKMRRCVTTATAFDAIISIGVSTAKYEIFSKT